MSGNFPVDYRWLPHDFNNIGGGLNIDAQNAAVNESRELINCDLNIRGSVNKRGGYRDCNATPFTLGASSTGMSSIFQFLKMVTGLFTKFLFVSYDDKIDLCTVDVADCLKITGRTNLISGLTDTNFSTVSMVNRAIFISPKHCLWSDGTGIHPLGIVAPAVAPLAVESATGTIPNGVYQVAYGWARSGNNGTYSNGSLLKSVTIAAGHGIDVPIVDPTDPQVNQVILYMSTLGGVAMYEVSRTTVVWVAGTVTPVGTLHIASDIITGTAMPIDYYPMKKGKYALVKHNTLWVANTEDTPSGSSILRKSIFGEPDVSGASDFFLVNPDDGDEITGLGELMNWVVVFKRMRVTLFEDSTGESVDLTNDDGCAASGSIQTVLDGRALVFLSDSGVKVTDGGGKPVSISDNKINSILFRTTDRTKWMTNTRSFYSPEERKYTLVLPALTAGNVIWLNYYFDSSGWSVYEYFVPTVFGLAQNQLGNIVALGGYMIGTAGYVRQLNYGLLDGAATIHMRVKMVETDMGSPGMEKQIRRAYVRWGASNPIFGAVFTVTTDFGMTAGCSKVINHPGGSFWGYAHWGHAYWGASGTHNDRVDLRGKGKTIEFAFDETSGEAVSLYGFTVLYYVVGARGTVDV